jgi:hypothetical protein
MNQDANRHAFQTWSVRLPPSILVSPAANQAQLYDKWLNIYTPVTCGTQGFHFDYLREAINMAESEPALRDGLNTLALVQVGHASNDEHLLAASVPSYGRALASLAYAVSKATSVRDNTVLAAASLLVVCEFYDKIKTQGMSWFGHVEGVQQLLLARGPDSLDTDLSLMLFCNARHASAARSFLLRKGDSYDTPAWRAAAWRAPMHDASIGLFDITIRVPRCLQRSDELDLNSPQALQNVRSLLNDCERLETELRNWQTSFHASLQTRGVKPYETVPIEHFQTFSRLVTDRTLPTCHRFNDFMSGYLHSQFWVAMHYLRSTIKELREQRQNLDPTFQTASYNPTSTRRRTQQLRLRPLPLNPALRRAHQRHPRAHRSFPAAGGHHDAFQEQEQLEVVFVGRECSEQRLQYGLAPAAGAAGLFACGGLAAESGSLAFSEL